MSSQAPALDYGRDPGSARRWLPLIVGLAIGIRLTLGWQHPFLFPDSADYDALAKAIVAHQPYEVNGNVATRMPGYPIFLAVLYALGAGVRGVMAVQAIMGGCVVLMTYVIGTRISNGVALVAAALLAADPLSVGLSAAVLTETPFTFCMMAAIWLCLRVGEEQDTRRLWKLWIGMGIFWGIGVYFRASALWCIIPLAAWGMLCMKQLSPEIRALMACTAIALVFFFSRPGWRAIIGTFIPARCALPRWRAYPYMKPSTPTPTAAPNRTKLRCRPICKILTRPSAMTNGRAAAGGLCEAIRAASPASPWSKSAAPGSPGLVLPNSAQVRYNGR